MVRQGAKFSGTIPGILTPPGLVTQLLTDATGRPTPATMIAFLVMAGSNAAVTNPTPQRKMPQVAPRNGRCQAEMLVFR